MVVLPFAIVAVVSLLVAWGGVRVRDAGRRRRRTREWVRELRSVVEGPKQPADLPIDLFVRDQPLH